MGIPYPCGSKPGYERIVGIYFKFLQFGANYTNKDELHAATLARYAKAILIIFTLQGFPSPINTSGQNNMGGIIITNHRREEDMIAMQRYPHSEILAKLGPLSATSTSEDSEQNLLFDITCLSHSLAHK